MGTSQFPSALDAFRRRTERDAAVDPSGADWNLVVDALLAIESNIQSLGKGSSSNSAAPRYGYFPNGWVDGWNNALSQISTSPAWAMCFGASIDKIGSAGDSGADYLLNSHFAKWRTTQLARFPSVNNGIAYGDSFIPQYGTNWDSNPSATPPFTYDVAPASWLSAAVGICPGYAAAATQPMFHYTHPSTALGYNARSFDVWIWDTTARSGQTFDIVVPSGCSAATTAGISVSGAGTTKTVTLGGTNTLQRIRITGAANTANQVLNFGNPSNNNAMAIVHVASYPGSAGPGTSGIGFAWNAAPGLTLHEYHRIDGTTPTDKAAQFAAPSNSEQGGSSNTAPPFTPQHVFPWSPNLLLLGMFDDPDYIMTEPTGTTVGVSPTTTVHALEPEDYGDALWRICDSVLSNNVDANGNANSSVLMNFFNVPSGRLSDVTVSASYYPENLRAYFAQYRQVQEHWGCGLINHHARWRGRGFNLGFQPNNNPHPKILGHADIALAELAVT